MPPPPAPESGILGEVTQVRVAGLLHQRRSRILDPEDPDMVPRFEERVKGAAVEVIPLVGADPIDPHVRALAVEAIALQTASEIEYAEYPEQQSPGDPGRGYHLHRRYLELLARLGETAGSTGPRGTFPEPLRDPDPIGLYPWR